MEAAEWSVTSLIYCWVFGLISEHLSFWFIFPLLSPDRKFIVKTDYSRIYTGVFPPFCPQSSLCLDFQQETTARADYSQIYTHTVFAYLH